MSNLNITRKIFLEKEELNRFQAMLEDSAVKTCILNNTVKWGIIRDEFTTEDLNFKVFAGTSPLSVKIPKTVSKAIGIDGKIIKQPAIDNILVPTFGEWYWLMITHKYRRWEVGSVNVSITGEISGANTMFTEVLRGQSTNTPTKIRFAKEDGTSVVNSGVYEVVTVGNNIYALLSSAVGFVEENNLKMIVVGATPISEIVTAEQLDGLYKYDDCQLTFVKELSENNPPLINSTNNSFYVARIKKTSTEVLIEDKRESMYWSFNLPGVTDRLSKFENLNDLSDKSAARTNLDVFNKAEVAALISAGSAAGALLAANNLSDLTDKTAARSNLEVLSTIQVNTALGLKADINYVDEQLELKADQTTVEGQQTQLDILNKGKVILMGNISSSATLTIDMKIDGFNFAVESVALSPLGYRVTHNIGHPRYYVNVQPLIGTSAYFSTCYAQGDDYFLITSRDQSGLVSRVDVRIMLTLAP